MNLSPHTIATRCMDRPEGRGRVEEAIRGVEETAMTTIGMCSLVVFSTDNECILIYFCYR